MSALGNRAPRGHLGTVVIEGYASLFGVEDRSGDVVRAGAFAASLRHTNVPMLLQHQAGAIAGRWTRIAEDGRGLFVRGVVDLPAAEGLIRDGLNGLSIGFRPRVWSPRPEGGRRLAKVDLVEISLVATPMLDRARFQAI